MNHYEVLGVVKTSSAQEIRKAYYKLAIKWHPDRHNNSSESNAKMKAIATAYAVLSDPEKRKIYDQTSSQPQSFFVKPESSKDTSKKTAADSSLPFSQFFKANPTIFSGEYNNDESSDRVNLPTAVLFTGEPTYKGEFKVVLLGSEAAYKYRFNTVLMDDIPLRPIGVDFLHYKTPNNSTFKLFDTAGAERFRSFLNTAVKGASVVLFFDNVDSYLDTIPALREHSQFFKLAYEGEKCTMDFVEYLDGQELKMDSREPYEAHVLSQELFAAIEGKLLNQVVTFVNKAPKKSSDQTIKLIQFGSSDEAHEENRSRMSCC